MSKLKRAVLNVVGSSLLPQGRLVSNEAIGQFFRRVRLQSDSLRNVEIKPGSKIQINVGEWTMRTYTPISVDLKKGEVEIIAFQTGKGPASAWLGSAFQGDIMNFKGPDGGLKPLWIESDFLLFGDETSIGLAIGLKQFLKEKNFQLCFEASAAQEMTDTLRSLGLTSASIYPKDPSGIHVHLNEEILKSARTNNGIKFILSGRAQSIQSLRNSLLSKGVPASKILSKVYWSVGQSGLD